MGYDQASDGTWCWTRAGSTLTLRVSDPRLRMRVAPEAPDRPLLIHADLPSIRLPDGPLALLAWLILSGIGIGLLWVLLRFAVVRLFLLEPPGHDAPQSSLSVAPGAIRAWVFVAPRATDFNAVVSDTSALLVDLRAASAPADCQLTEERRGRTVVIDHLEARLTNPEWSTAVLALLERLVFVDRAKVVVLSEIDPLAFLSGQFAASEPTDSEAREIVERFWRWVQLFAACDLHVEEPAGDPTAPGIARQQLAAKRRITETAASFGDAAYWRIWSQSTKAEKLALSQLAREGLLNPNNRAVATRLMERGLVVRGPAFDLFDPSFRQFVLRAEAPRDVLDWEQEESGHGWARIQIPFLVAMVVIVGFFFLTQPQMYSVAIALLGALTTAVPLVLQLIGFFGRQRTAGGGG